MDEVKDGNRTSGARPEGTGARESRTQLGKPVQDNVDNSDATPNWEERYKAQREITRRIEVQKNEALKQRDELLNQREIPKADNDSKDSLSSVVVDEIRKINARLDAKEKEEYVEHAIKAHGGISDDLAAELKDLPMSKIDSILAKIPAPKIPVTKPDQASVTGKADVPINEKRAFAAEDLEKMTPSEVLEAHKKGLIVDGEGNSIT